MPTYRRLAAAAAIALIATAGQGAGSALMAEERVRFTTPEAAYEQGLGAIRSGRSELAVQAFEFAADRDHLRAQYYLGKLFSNNNSQLTDHGRAFDLFHGIVDKYKYVDPLLDYRASYVTRSFVALAAYYRLGVPALGIKADARAAVELLNHAAGYFSDVEAQFQLAKMYLAGEGVAENVRTGLRWLKALADDRHHAGAQARLAEILWHNKFPNHILRDPTRALSYISVAVENAPEQDQLWIDEIHQTIYCGTTPSVREQARGMVADWLRRVPAVSVHPTVPVQTPADRTFLQTDRRITAGPLPRTCADGAPVGRIGNQTQAPSKAIEGNARLGSAAAGSHALREIETPGPSGRR